jgi:hypothetical protein
MKEYEVTIAKVVYSTSKEFNTELEARMWGAEERDKLSALDNNKVEYYFEVEEISND